MLKKLTMLMLCFWVVYVQGLCQVFFTPRDNIRAQLISLIKQERKSIDLAMYMFTDKTIAQALVDAYVRGVKVTVALDQISMGERYGKGVFLRNNGVLVYEHVSSNFNAFSVPIMHHKFFIFGHNATTGSGLLWTGSYNCTASASTIHDENVMLTDDQGAIQEYKKCFNSLLERLNPERSFLDEDEDFGEEKPFGVA